MDMKTLSGSPLFQMLIEKAEKVERGYLKHEDGCLMTDDQLAELNKALGLTKDKDYRPYCMRCDLMPRVALRSNGFECWSCKNTFGFDLKKHAQ